MKYLKIYITFSVFYLVASVIGKHGDTNNTNEFLNFVQNNEKKSTAHAYETVNPKIKSFKSVLVLEGFIEDPNSISLQFEVDHWNELKVISAPKHGKMVKRGDVLLRLDLEKIKLRLVGLNHELATLEVDRKILETEIELSKKLAPLKKKEVDLKLKQAEQDLNRFQEIDLPFEMKSSEMKVKRYENSLSYSTEELTQLQKMYEADDLTEETEEIILQRAKNEVDQDKFALETAQVRFAEFKEVKAPRKEQSALDSFDQEVLTLLALQQVRPAELRKQMLKSKKLDISKKNLLSQIEKLEKDLDNMVLRSPNDGIIYWGTFERGKWSGVESLKPNLKKGGILKPYVSILTLTPGEKVVARINLKEEDLKSLSPKQTGVIELASDPEIEVTGRIMEISQIPFAPGLFDATVELLLPKNHPPPKPSTACKFKITTYEKKHALVLPEKVVFSDKFEGGRKFVYILNKHGKIRKKFIEVGKKSYNYLEIMDGLGKYSKVLMEKPKNLFP